MSTKQIYLIHDYIAILTQLILLYFVQTFINISSSTNINYLFGLIYLPILLTCYLSLKHLKTIIVPIILFIVYYISFFIFPFSVAETACSIILTTIVFLLFLKKWNNELNSTYTITPSLAFILLFVLISVAPNMRMLSLILGLSFLLTYFLEKYLKNLCSYCNNNAYIHKLPISQIININIYSIIVFIFASLAIYLLIRIFHIDSFLYNLFLPIIIKIKNFLISFINWIIGAISSNSGDTIDYKFENSSTDFNLGTNSGEPSLFWKIVSFLSNTLKVIVIVFLIYKAIDIIYKFFLNNFKKKMDDSDTVTSIKNTKDNYSSFISKNVFKFLKPKDNNTKIRNLYIKLVSSSKVANQNNINSMTAKEISSIISKDKSVDELTSIYEKARYRDIECSKEEVNKAKKLL